MPRVSLKPLNRTLDVPAGTPLIDVLHEFGVEFPCGGRGACGGCKVRVLAGDLPVDAEHQKRLDALGLTGAWRLACRSRVESDVTLRVDQWEHLILADQTEFDFEPQPGFGIAVDVGTTTLVAQLVELQTAKILAAASAVNPQNRYGADIMSRVEYAVTQTAEPLTATIRGAIFKLIRDLLAGRNVPVHKIILVGNTVMHHLFCGIDLTPLSQYPFESPENGRMQFTAAELDWPLAGDPDIAFMPCIGSFVGSDVLAGILAAGMHKTEQTSCLIDLGTNGEIVVGNRDGMLCASTAAGPAFEGINISCGMTAATGAVSSVRLENGAFHAHIIGNTAPRGICGSGLLDAVACLLSNGQLDEWGQFNDGVEGVELIPGVPLTQNDIRQVQLAKGAVAAGVELLAKQHCQSLEHVEHFFIAGAFGNYLDLANARRIGLLDAAPDAVTTLGNSALLGAKMMLYLNETDLQTALQTLQHTSLETDPDFQETFAMRMLF